MDAKNGTDSERARRVERKREEEREGERRERGRDAFS